MDSAAFQEIIALARGTAAELAAAEKKVSAFLKMNWLIKTTNPNLMPAPTGLVR